MLKEETLQRIASLTKVKVEDLKAAIISTDEVDFPINEKVSSLTEDEIQQLKNNEYNSGKKAGVEIAVKDVKEKLNLDFQGKTIDGLLDAHGKKVLADAKIEPEKKVVELNEKITNLQKTVQEKEAAATELEQKLSRSSLNSELYKAVPVIEGLEQDDVIALMERKGYEFKMDSGKVVVHKDGSPVIDNLSNNRAPKDVINEFLTEKKLNVTGSGEGGGPAGRGGKDGAPITKFTKLSELKKHFQDQNKSVLGDEFQQAFEKAKAEFKEFDLQA